MKYKVALFDLDGVIFDTEPQYDIFWGETAARFRPDAPEMVKLIKGTTLVSTFRDWFSGEYEYLRPQVLELLNNFEAQMQFTYVPGFQEFASFLGEKGVRMAIVTSSNHKKMGNVYRSHPELLQRFDAILTSEDFKASKPHPDCYLKAAARLGAAPSDCVVFEDSFSGLASARASGAFVVGVATAHSPEDLKSLSDLQITDFTAPEAAALF